MKMYRIANLVFHNTKKDFLGVIKSEGLTAGTFSDRPIDFGGDVWLAVEETILGKTQKHQYGDVMAIEPRWEGEQGETVLTVPPEMIFLVNKNGRILGKLI